MLNIKHTGLMRSLSDTSDEGSGSFGQFTHPGFIITNVPCMCHQGSSECEGCSELVSVAHIPPPPLPSPPQVFGGKLFQEHTENSLNSDLIFLSFPINGPLSG